MIYKTPEYPYILISLISICALYHLVKQTNRDSFSAMCTQNDGADSGAPGKLLTILQKVRLGWGERIRTPTVRTRTVCPTIRRLPIYVYADTVIIISKIDFSIKTKFYIHTFKIQK